MQQADCSADQLQRLLSDEISALDNEGTKAALARWADLPQILGRMREVLRPAPGTPLEETVGRALNIALDVLERAGHEKTSGQKVDNLVAEHFGANAEKVQRINPADWAGLWAAVYELKPVDPESDETWSDGGCERDKLSEIVKTYFLPEDTKGAPTRAQCNGLNLAVRQFDACAELKRGISQRIGLLRSLVNASVDQKYGTTVQLAGALLADLITQDCSRTPDGKKCQVALTSTRAEKWFGVIGAFTSYAASYDAKPSEDASADKIAEYRSEERKKAMNELIDSATDRRGRGLDSVFSLGVMVGFSAGKNHLYRTDECKDHPGTCATKESVREWSTGLSLPTGIAWEVLPQGVGFPQRQDSCREQPADDGGES